MKKIVLAMIATLSMSATTMAQDADQQRRPQQRRMDPVEMAKQRTQRTVEHYGLDSAQAVLLLDLNTRYAGKMGPGFRTGRRGGPGQRPMRGNPRAQQRPDTLQAAPQDEQPVDPRQVMEAYEAELQQIMTPEQFERYKADMQQRMQQGRRGQGPRQGSRMGQRPQRQHMNNE